MITISDISIETTERSRRARCTVSGQNLNGVLEFSGKSNVPFASDIAFADWAAIGLLYPAMQFGEDLVIDGPVSSRLLFYINSDIQRLLKHFNPSLHLIEVSAQPADMPKPARATGVATSYSAGVDTFATLLKYARESAPAELAVNSLTVFDVGAFGTGPDAKKLFQTACDRMFRFAENDHLNTFTLDTNLGDFYLGRPSQFQMTHVIRNAAGALFFQDVFRIYHYSSTYPYKELNHGQDDMSFIEAVLLPLLSTARTEFHCAGASLSRLEKTALIATMPETFDQLDLCVANPKKRERVGKTNCSACWKCRRALIHFEILGTVENYGAVFDLDRYFKNRESAVATVIKSALSGKPADIDLLELMVEKNFESTALQSYLQDRAKA